MSIELKQSTVYIRAAMTVDNREHEFSCIAIKRALAELTGEQKYLKVDNFDKIPETRNYAELMLNEEDHLHLLSGETLDDARAWRVYMLLMMAAIVEGDNVEEWIP